jgi:LysM repeat protein
VADSAGDAVRVGTEPFLGIVCPLLVVVEGRTHARADEANRCAASEPPAPLSMAQQRLVCLDAGHVDCPRFVRAQGSGRGGSGRVSRPASTRGGSVVVPGVAGTAGAAATAGPAATAGRPDRAPTNSSVGGETGSSHADPGRDLATASPAEAGALPSDPAVVPAPLVPATPVVPVAPVVRSTRRSGARPARPRPGPTVVAVGILLVALVFAVVFTSIRGGLTLPGAVPSLGTASPGPSLTLSPGPSAETSPSLVASPTPDASPAPTPTPLSSPTPAGTPQPSVPPAFTGMKPCSDAPDCYLYRVRSGDNLTRIAERFGVTTAAIRELNPEITDPSLIHVGDMIRIPLPPG